MSLDLSVNVVALSCIRKRSSLDLSVNAVALNCIRKRLSVHTPDRDLAGEALCQSVHTPDRNLSRDPP